LLGFKTFLVIKVNIKIGKEKVPAAMLRKAAEAPDGMKFEV